MSREALCLNVGLCFPAGLSMTSLEWISDLRIAALLGAVKKWGGNHFKGAIEFQKRGAPVGRQGAATGVGVGEVQGSGKT